MGGQGGSQTAQGSPLHQLHQALCVHEEDLPLSFPLQRGRVGVQHVGDLWGEGTRSGVAQGHRAASSPFPYSKQCLSLFFSFSPK